VSGAAAPLGRSSASVPTQATLRPVSRDVRSWPYADCLLSGRRWPKRTLATGQRFGIYPKWGRTAMSGSYRAPTRFDDGSTVRARQKLVAVEFDLTECTLSEARDLVNFRV
jgi:hypothetical protein